MIITNVYQLDNCRVWGKGSAAPQISHPIPIHFHSSLLDYAAMKRSMLRGVCLLLVFTAAAFAQEVIPIYQGSAPGSAAGTYPEKQYFSKVWNTEVVSNVTQPSLTVFKPSAELKNGTAVVIFPGGGFMALSIASEGTEVAQYLSARGVTAFVLKYRLAHTGEDATQEFASLYSDRSKFEEKVSSIIPLSIADGLAAVIYVRQHAAEFGISANRVGVMGFSAGGVLAAAAALKYVPEGRPAFVAAVYAAIGRFRDSRVPGDAPPIFIAAASDDNLGLAPDSVALYEKWRAADKPVELHMYAKGGHGFGMRRHGLPVDHWIDRFAEWMEMQGLMNK
jgi:acetyl esterase/lipase